MRGDPDQVTSTIIAPNTPTWRGLLDVDRRLVLDWTQRPRTALQPAASPVASNLPRQHAQPLPQRLVSDIQAEIRWAMRVRTWRDAGSFVAVAVLGAGVALHVRPPLASSTAGTAAAWSIALILGVRYLTGRARGQGITGTAEGNAAYFACPEHYAVGGLYSACLGASLGIVAMIAALVAKVL